MTVLGRGTSLIRSLAHRQKHKTNLTTLFIYTGGGIACLHPLERADALVRHLRGALRAGPAHACGVEELRAVPAPLHAGAPSSARGARHRGAPVEG